MRGGPVLPGGAFPVAVAARSRLPGGSGGLRSGDRGGAAGLALRLIVMSFFSLVGRAGVTGMLSDTRARRPGFETG